MIEYIKDLVTNELFISSVIFAVTYAVNEYVKRKSVGNPEQDAWDEIYNVTDRVVAFVEQTHRKAYGFNKPLDENSKKELKSIAIETTYQQLSPKVEEIVMKNKKSGNIFKQLLGTVVEERLLKLKNKYIK